MQTRLTRGASRETMGRGTGYACLTRLWMIFPDRFAGTGTVSQDRRVVLLGTYARGFGREGLDAQAEGQLRVSE